MSLKKLWKHSRLRFYFVNAKWNFSFWLFCEKIYKDINYEEPVDEFKVAADYNITQNKIKHTKRRFVGYFYKGRMFLDNPGIQGEDIETMNSWMKKGLL